MNVLVDTSVWVDYFRGSSKSDDLDALIDNNEIAINDLILAELVPPLRLRGETQLVDLLQTIPKHLMKIDWDGIIQLQVTYLQNGINKVGIPDLLIAQNAIQHNLRLFSLDKHFALMGQCMSLSLH